jgi:hypothetical protein
MKRRSPKRGYPRSFRNGRTIEGGGPLRRSESDERLRTRPTSPSELQKAGFPLSLELKSGNLPKRSWVKISQIRRLSVERISKKIGNVSAEEIESVIEGLNEIIGS